MCDEGKEYGGVEDLSIIDLSLLYVLSQLPSSRCPIEVNKPFFWPSAREPLVAGGLLRGLTSPLQTFNSGQKACSGLHFSISITIGASFETFTS